MNLLTDGVLDDDLDRGRVGRSGLLDVEGGNTIVCQLPLQGSDDEHIVTPNVLHLSDSCFVTFNLLGSIRVGKIVPFP